MTDAEEWFRNTATQYEGALVILEDGDDYYFRFRETTDSVLLVASAPGQTMEYSYEEFHEAVESGIATLATSDHDEEVFHTPDGDQPW